MKAIGCNIFAGGFTLGVREHFEVLAHFEHAKPYGMDVMDQNLPGLFVHYPKEGWPRSPRYPGERERTRFVYANPPCAPFSGASAGRATSWDKDPRLSCFVDSFELLFDIQPDVLAIESVCDSFAKARAFTEQLSRRAAAEGYATTILFHNARYLGVPQIRKRVFYVYHRVAFEPAPVDFESEVTVRQAFRGLRIPAATRKRWKAGLRPVAAQLAAQTPPGGRLAKTFNALYPEPERRPDGKVADRPSFLETRIPWDKPANVLMGGNKLIHPVEDRYLYPEELLRLATFPDTWVWENGLDLGTAGKHLSQGIAPKVGAWLAEGVRASIERGRRLNRPFYGIRDLRHCDEPLQIIHDDARLIEEGVPWEPAPPIVRAPPAPRSEPLSPSATPRRPGSGTFIRTLLAEGKLTPDQILDRVHAEFPGSKATRSDIAWNKRKLQLEGI